MKLTVVTYKFKDTDGTGYTASFNIALSQWTVFKDDKAIYTTPSFNMPITDDSALRIIKRALKID